MENELQEGIGFNIVIHLMCTRSTTRMSFHSNYITCPKLHQSLLLEAAKYPWPVCNISTASCTISFTI
jgi:hypothetical protein